MSAPRKSHVPYGLLASVIWHDVGSSGSGNDRGLNLSVNQNAIEKECGDVQSLGVNSPSGKASDLCCSRGLCRWTWNDCGFYHLTRGGRGLCL